MRNTQRYRFIFEFVLRDRADYILVREHLKEATDKLEAAMGGGMKNDFMSLEKCEPPGGKE